MEDNNITGAVTTMWQLSQRTEFKVQAIEQVRQQENIAGEIEAADTLEQLIEDNRTILLEVEENLRRFREAQAKNVSENLNRALDHELNTKD